MKWIYCFVAVSLAAGCATTKKGEPNRTTDEVAQTVNLHLNSVRNCYETALKAKPDLKGKTVLKWTITKTGAVEDVGVVSSELKDKGFETCLVDTVKGMKYEPADGTTIITQYPFIFSRGKERGMKTYVQPKPEAETPESATKGPKTKNE